MELNWNHMAEYLREVCGKGRGRGRWAGAQLTATRTQQAGCGLGIGAGEGPGGRLAHGLLGCPVSTVIRQAVLGCNSVKSVILTLSKSIQGPLTIWGSYPDPRGGLNPIPWGRAWASSFAALDSHLHVSEGFLPSVLHGLPPGQHVVPITPEFPQIYNTLSNL